MSYYQSYEFLALDRSLSSEQRDELRRYSTRAEISATRFYNIYHWGSFKGHPQQWLMHYFDAYLCQTASGPSTIGLAFPAKELEMDQVESWRDNDFL